MIKLRPLKSILDLIRDSDYEGNHDWFDQEYWENEWNETLWDEDSSWYNDMYDEQENPMYDDKEVNR